ncbi:DNA-binding NarL/FixJ family response regulator [Catenuloplanes nepalensis]|uniref:DNA-binding NarL/FixJ family response regulator n=1 Tax=Catenuloplanes nepalensis TaxID=587533 RepID=A0ABT9MVT4_9ACTN|nr:response regulator transcription factor [Catenuloplanes nepalensis]MDP9795545.1 DNA-binding NarL/FixJ family response regulator [Catenuloplanes nepalensis]
MAQTKRVLVVDDHPVVRRGLRAMLEGESWVSEVLEASTVADAVREAVAGQADVVAMDFALPDGDGIEATRRILAARPAARIVMLTMTDDHDVVLKALNAGAAGFVVKDDDPDVVIDALRTAGNGGVVLGPSITATVLGGMNRGTARELPPPFDKLTPREREIMSHLLTGEPNAEIAKHLTISEKTIRNQLTAVFAKIGVTDRTQAVLRARDVGMAAAH